MIALVALGSVGSVMKAAQNSDGVSVSDSASAVTSAASSSTSQQLSVSDTSISSETTTAVSETTEAASVTEIEETKAEPFVLDISGYGMENWGNIDTGNLKLSTGDLLSVIYSEGDVLIVKAKIQSQLSNRLTIDQNYYNVGDLIKKHGFDACQELQYWAVADSASGDEIKVISFTLDRATIEAVKNGSILENQLGDYVSDLFIHQSLID